MYWTEPRYNDGNAVDRAQNISGYSPVYMAQTNPGRTRVRPRLKLTQVVFSRHFSKLTRVEPGLVVFTRQINQGRTRVSSVYTTETNPG